MRRVTRIAWIALAIGFAPAGAQGADPGAGEIIVTAQRRTSDNYDDKIPAIGLKRIADFAIQPLKISGDTREPATRHDEIYQTMRRAIELAPSFGVQLATGEMVVQPLTLANYHDITLEKDSRPDSDKVEILLKAPLGNGGSKDATQRIDRFLKAIKPVGRALVEANEDLTLSIVAPDQYRGDIGALIAKDGAAMAARFGAGYSVEVRGLNRPVEWTRASLTEVLLYIPYELTVVPTR